MSEQPVQVWRSSARPEHLLLQFGGEDVFELEPGATTIEKIDGIEVGGGRGWVELAPVGRPASEDAITDAVELASDAVHAQWMETKHAQGVASRCSESGEELMVPYAELSEAAKDLDRGSVRATVTALAEAGLLADPAQTTELERLKARITQYQAELDKARSERAFAVATSEAWKQERDDLEAEAQRHMQRDLNRVTSATVARNTAIAERDAAERERDALSLLLRGMARKLVAYRKWTLGDDVPEVHRLRRQLAEVESERDEARAQRNEAMANAARHRENHKLCDEAVQRHPGLTHVLAWLNRKVEQIEAEGDIDHDPKTDGQHYAYVQAHAAVALAITHPERWLNEVWPRLAGGQPPAEEPPAPRCYCVGPTHLIVCADQREPLSGMALRAVEEADDAAEPACECFVVPEEQWTRHYDATEPGSMVEQNPDCPVHPAQQTDAAGDLP